MVVLYRLPSFMGALRTEAHAIMKRTSRKTWAQYLIIRLKITRNGGMSEANLARFWTNQSDMSGREHTWVGIATYQAEDSALTATKTTTSKLASPIRVRTLIPLYENT